MTKNVKRYLNSYYWLRKIFSTNFFKKYFFLSMSFKRKILFNSIYKSYHWRDYHKPNEKESVSGLGSDVSRCDDLVLDLKKFIKENNINSILDLACGDFVWMKDLVVSNDDIIDYCGLEIVEEIVKKNQNLYGNNKIKFKNCDIISDDYPINYDLLIIRDIFIHLTNDEIMKVIKKIKSNSYRFIAINNFSNISSNKDLKSFGSHRELNIENKPFNLGKPSFILNDIDRQINIYETSKLK
ncbi:MAG: hypothetical protein CBC24_06485 [Candidatus Pelagibacter sp. TMED64]|nr:hypothetical protein [Candidatus Pelagibacter sp.]OUU64868.1 MAG: hypothetical protein CBC24_06485 [Candidatus Pelagibacter sp. TMED64]|tara:strand:- start:3939 stop:4658 length:720 start_codon:yes stop_codon:yes gene_type:complete